MKKIPLEVSWIQDRFHATDATSSWPTGAWPCGSSWSSVVFGTPSRSVCLFVCVSGGMWWWWWGEESGGAHATNQKKKTNKRGRPKGRINTMLAGVYVPRLASWSPAPHHGGGGAYDAAQSWSSCRRPEWSVAFGNHAQSVWSQLNILITKTTHRNLPKKKRPKANSGQSIYNNNKPSAIISNQELRLCFALLVNTQISSPKRFRGSALAGWSAIFEGYIRGHWKCIMMSQQLCVQKTVMILSSQYPLDASHTQSAPPRNQTSD